ncbi:hypothetical protein BDV98DRAFT_562000, partial [Pterulicium gracile]
HGPGNKNQTKTVKHFAEVYPDIGFTQPLVSDWVKKEAVWRAKVAVDGSRTKRVRQTES